MRAVVQRVHQASVQIEEKTVGTIGRGLCVFLGIGSHDTKTETRWLAKKISRLRIFPDSNDKMSLNLLDIEGEILVVSQFTLYGSCRAGCRPDFANAAPVDLAQPLYEQFLLDIEQETGICPQKGEFQKKMTVFITNDGPVTLIIDTPLRHQS